MPLFEQCFANTDHGVDSLVGLTGFFAIMNNMRKETINYANMGNSNDFTPIMTLQSNIDDARKNPRNAKFSRKVNPRIVQPLQHYEIIKSLMNADTPGEITCEKAQDLLVNRYSDCPRDYTRIIGPTELATYRDLLGEKCCFVLTKFNSTFWNERYGSPANPCRIVRDKISTYLLYYATLNW